MSADSGNPEAPPRVSISVVVCAFTTERLDALEAALESVRAQTLPAEDIVLVVDHAPDLLEEARARWPEATIVPNRELPGLSGARNTGVAECEGDVVAFLDDDALAAPDWLERLASHYDRPEVAGAGGAVRPAWEEGRPPWFPPEFDWVVGCTHSGMPREPAAVRNLVGANMSFRRDVLEAVGGFRHELGRVGTKPVGCEETELSIRAARQAPGGTIVYDPRATVDHLVPRGRSRLRYFVSRCVAEGRSKAVLARMVGGGDGLASEREYTRRTLPAGLLRGLRDALRGDPGGLGRAAAIPLGLATTACGYLLGRGLLRGPLVRRGEDRPPGPLRVRAVTPRSPMLQGGVERHVMEVSSRLAAAGVDVEVLCADPGGPETRDVGHEGVAIRIVRAWPAKRDWRFAPGVWREIASAPWDVVHVQSYHTFVAPLAMLRALSLGIPYVVTFHGGGHSAAWRNRIRRAQRAALRPLLSRAARLVAVARFEIDQYGRELRIPRERFELIPNGTDPVPRLPDVPARNGDGPELLASIGRLERYKGHHRVIAAMPYVLAERPETRLLVVGTGPYEGRLRRAAADLGLDDKVEFTSVPPNDPSAMARLLGRTSLVVLLSEFETHPLVALEAAAAGRRLLVADRSGLAELADEGFARAVDPEEAPGSIGRAILEELSAPPPDVRPELPTWDDTAEALHGLYRTLAART